MLGIDGYFIPHIEKIRHMELLGGRGGVNKPGLTHSLPEKSPTNQQKPNNSTTQQQKAKTTMQQQKTKTYKKKHHKILQKSRCGRTAIDGKMSL